jgi:hypothetical protein
VNVQIGPMCDTLSALLALFTQKKEGSMWVFQCVKSHVCISIVVVELAQL